MKAMKQVVIGGDFPMSYMSNVYGVSVEAEEIPEGWSGPLRYLPVPFYKTADGDCVVRWKLTAEERLAAIQGVLLVPRVGITPTIKKILGSTYDLVFGSAKISDTIEDIGGTVSFTEPLSAIHIPTEYQPALIGHGFIWQTLRLLNGGLKFHSVSAVCPFSPEEEMDKLRASRRITHVMMAGKDMVPDNGEAEVVTIKTENGTSFVHSHEVSIYNDRLFYSENEVIAAVAMKLREVNAGKWDANNDVASYQGMNEGDAATFFPTLKCPTCGIALQRPMGSTYQEHTWICPQCNDKFVVTDRESATVENITHSFRDAAIAGGFTEQQAEFLKKVLDKR